MVESGGLMGNEIYVEKGEEVVKEKTAVKYCPIMTSGNVSASQWNQVQTRVQCMGVSCGIWNQATSSCGLIR